MSSTAVVRRRAFSPEFGRKVWVDRTSLELTDELTFEEWVNLGEQLTEVGDSMAWWVGDWIEQGTVVYGGKYADALEVMALDLSTLQNYAYIARRPRSSTPRTRTSGRCATFATRSETRARCQPAARRSRSSG
jgi:hypothetical protein